MTPSLSIDRPLLHRTVLPNGLVVIVIENPVADIISARILVQSRHRLGTAIARGSHEPARFPDYERD
jgi:hypothetical protein